MTERKKWQTQTRMVHEGAIRSPFGETAEALYLTSGYVYDSAEQAEARFNEEEDGYIYSRFGNPTVRAFETRMMALEGAEDARATATGMAAVTACMMSQLEAGDHIVAARALFGSCRYVVETLMPRFGVECTLVDGRDLDAWKAALRPETKILFLETPSNPVLEIIDIQAVADIAHNHGAQLVVDNVFATPVLQKPLALGADITIYSATKHIDGQGRCLGGIILGREDYVRDQLAGFMRQTGPSLAPFNAWVMLKALETLELRVKAHCDNAETLTQMLSAHQQVERVYYPHDENHPQFELAQKQMTRGSNLIAFDLKGGKADAFKLANGLEIALISNNLGDAKTLITHPATTTHSKLSDAAKAELAIAGGTLRVSVGLEDGQDLLDDFEQALAKLG
ncbi:O-succinylhomoserine sulfhydrylase [Alphaproteobacteria bacterium]|nr:O-succinylhomoserine sulfhydrylase [Alphaproteobacteria bacterium]MDA8624667.1 O-succinylhomoserine sulfhydrylase [Alphaproteobacteria bacterium]MDA9590850.1 O-succinylhomoserine sulfhydrylase [Alphaproteobacteria bacterium]MDB2431289.1 O-succinylhomoserine sulfhydrylase [Alphaproteobacteria bacterium]MDB2431512.1 O-succinylhomoserine sulfhydrylase [Alphaproteobacteria bacterium]